MFIYVDSFVRAGSSKEVNRNYMNDLWALESQHLDRLYDFLRHYFQDV